MFDWNIIPYVRYTTDSHYTDGREPVTVLVGTFMLGRGCEVDSNVSNNHWEVHRVPAYPTPMAGSLLEGSSALLCRQRVVRCKRPGRYVHARALANALCPSGTLQLYLPFWVLYYIRRERARRSRSEQYIVCVL